MVKRNIKVHELVSSWDKDKDGSIDAVEFARNMQMMVPNAKDGEVRSLFERLDAADSKVDAKVELESFRELLRGLERRASKARDEERALAAHVKELNSEASAGQQALLAAIEKDEAEERTREEAAAQATAAEEAGRAETEAAARKAKAARAAQAAEEKAAFEARVNEKRGKQRQVVEGSTPPISNQGTPRQSKATPRKTTSRKTTPRQTPRSKKQGHSLESVQV